jgi:tetratricopeptide (TPR) repeat protein
MKARVMKHNPAFLTREELVQSFVVRHVDLELVLERLREGGEGPNQHILLIGPRGIGKTTLVLRVAAAVEAEPELNKKWYPLVFSEESYEVATAAEFWLEAILHLADQTGDARLHATYDELKKQRDEQRLYEQALARLMDFADAQGKRLLVIVENMNMILGEQLSPGDGWTLRHTFQNEHRIMMLGTATTRFDEIENIKKAMYDLFWTHDLRPLDTEECRAVWASVTGKEISARRVRPIQILTGGSPRLLTILAAFAADISLRELMSKLTQLVDEHTTYFKSNLESLPAAERKVYVALADIWSPATAREVADAARFDVNKASALLHRLVQRGAVVEAKKKGRKVSYQVAERMYNIYHLMRRRGGEASRVRAVVDFMVHMYDEEGLVDVTRAIADEACRVDPEVRRDHFAAFRSILEHTSSPEARASLWTSIEPEFFKLEDAPSEIKDLLHSSGHVKVREKRTTYVATPSRGEDAREPWGIEQWMEAINQGEVSLEQMERAARKDVEVTPNRCDAWIRLGLSLSQLDRFDEAEAAARKVIELDPKSPLGFVMLGGLLETRGRDAEAADAYERSLMLEPRVAGVACSLGNLRQKLKDHSAAEKAFRLAIGIQPSNAAAWNGCSMALGDLERYEEAEKTIRQAIRLDVGDANSWIVLSGVLMEEGRIEESGRALEDALRLYKDNWNEVVIRSLIASHLVDLGKWQEALEEANRALSNEKVVRESPAVFSAPFMRVAARGHAPEALAVLQSSPARSHLEPLLVALQIMTGEEHNAPQEVVEVAGDIVKQVEELKRQAQSAASKKSSERPRAAKRPKASSTKPRRTS